MRPRSVIPAMFWKSVQGLCQPYSLRMSAQGAWKWEEKVARGPKGARRWRKLTGHVDGLWSEMRSKR